MQKMYLLRVKSSDAGTFGKVISEDLKFECFSGELPDRGNRKNISRILPGTYYCTVRWSYTFKRLVYELHNVKDRSNILIHPANFCGDRNKGYKCDLEGCICLGKHYGTLSGQEAVLSSRAAINAFMDFLDYKPFELVIRDL